MHRVFNAGYVDVAHRSAIEGQLVERVVGAVSGRVDQQHFAVGVCEGAMSSAAIVVPKWCRREVVEAQLAHLVAAVHLAKAEE